MLRVCQALIFILYYLYPVNCLQRQSLEGKWTVKGSSIEIPATVPGGIFSDLMSNNTIKDIFYGYGDSNYSWVGLDNWTYSSTFAVNQELFNYESILLVVEGLDTFATISINGNDVGKSENMFVRYNYNISGLLKAGSNEIAVKFESAVTKAENLRLEQDKSYSVPPKCPYANANGICNPNQIRKMQAAFGWDWGPAFSSTGIWKPIYLEYFNTTSIEYVVANPLKTAQGWTLAVTTYLTSAKNIDTLDFFNVSLVTDQGLISVAKAVKLVHNDHDETLVTTELLVPQANVKLWWPNGYGDQILYKLIVHFVTAGDQDTKNIKIGFRTIELVQEPIPGSKGLSFYFRVNGIGIFARGANQIPVNVLPELGQNQTVVKHLLKSVKDVNMNMLRVWGGGVYESDYFYELCDEYGILIWQDFMFACSMYPTRPEYLKSVTQEVSHQVKRLSSHASIAVWAGNNENEAAFAQNWYGTSQPQYREDYVKLYVDTIKSEVIRLVPTATYVVSSPSNGKASDSNGYIAQNPQDEFYGDVHFYNYYDEGWDYKVFPIPRFASEYGYQSMPSYDTWLQAIDDPLKNVEPDSTFMEYRQHHAGGNLENLDLINKQLTLPSTNDPNYVKTFIYYSQIIQAQAIKTETEHYRSFKGRLGSDQKGYTMGSLYWQLNDVWVAPTWSSIDFTGKWKMLHYFAKNFYSNSIVTGKIDEKNVLHVFAVTDDHSNTESVTVDVQIYKWNSFKPSTLSFNTTFNPLKAVEVATIDAQKALSDAGCGSTFDTSKNECFFVFTIPNKPNLAPLNYVFPAKLKDTRVAKGVIRYEVTQKDASGLTYQIKLTSDSIALFVWLDNNIPGLFSENGFLLLTPEKTVTFTAESAVNLNDLQQILTVNRLLASDAIPSNSNSNSNSNSGTKLSTSTLVWGIWAFLTIHIFNKL